MSMKAIGVLSSNLENIDNEPDPLPKPLEIPNVDLGPNIDSRLAAKIVAINRRPNIDPLLETSFGHFDVRLPDMEVGPLVKSKKIVRLTDHPNAQEIMSYTTEQAKRWNVNVALLGQRKYMINNCFGIKVSAGEFSLRAGESSFSSIPNGGVELKLVIDRISMTALNLRMRPRADILRPCKFGGRFQVGGSASNVRVEIHYDPRINLSTCELASLGDIDIKVRIGNLNLKPLQNDLDKVAKDMVEDAITYALNVFLPSQIALSIGSFPGGICISKLALYRLYMQLVSTGVTMYTLPIEYVKILQPFYPNVDLNTVKFGFSNRQLKSAITDCNRIYFNSDKIVDGIRNQIYDLSKDTKIDEIYKKCLYHELRHVEQCAELGGRDAYAERWFRDVEYSILLNLIYTTSGASMRNIHDWMPMESDAEDREQYVYKKLCL